MAKTAVQLKGNCSMSAAQWVPLNEHLLMGAAHVVLNKFGAKINSKKFLLVSGDAG